MTNGTGAPKFTKTPRPDDVHLRLLATSDLHMQIWPFDYYRDAPGGNGLARVASLLKVFRNEVPNTLTFDNGDILQGSPMGDYWADEEPEGTHPMIAALNTLALDAATVGNHEFNYGLPFLERTCSAAHHPIVNANLHHAKDQGATFLKPFVLLERQVEDYAGKHHTLKIGVIGFLPPQTTAWDQRHLKGQLITREIVDAATEWVPKVKAAGADIVIALSHSGIGRPEATANMENASVPLAAVNGIDAIIAGHTHLVFPSDDHQANAAVDTEVGRIHGKPVVMPGFGGSHLGVIDLLLTQGNGGWLVRDSQSLAYPVPPDEEDPVVLEATRSAHQATLAYVRRPIGRTSVPLHSYFTPLGPTSAVQLVADAQATRMAEILHGTPYHSLPLLSCAAPFKAGGRGGPGSFTEVPPGDVALRHVAHIYAYPNLLTAILVTGAQLRDWLEHVAGYYNRIAPLRTAQPLVSAAFPSHDFDTITGVRYEFDLTRPARFKIEGALADQDAWRVRNLTFNGSAVEDDQQFIVATNDYRASGDGSFPGAHQGEVVVRSPEFNRDIVAKYLGDAGPSRQFSSPNWSLTPIAGATVCFKTGPGARRYR
ncbi:MAG: bifunctional 2',3'-cyclic-nucleotide 2'-phosphodiesterase/3'-nucleotidase, partial [Paracoccaceae bacterium]|nr:bifunctional 2',3'-cyclic-nucleotide 2'-phosphodiesterase/3'-nucleotidase [Paracoccaceae bacterium]